MDEADQSPTPRDAELTMQTIGEKLRTAREAQGRTLDDVSAETRINRRFLDELERGILPNVPMTYVRAFVRSYASAIGLNPEELLRDSSLTATPAAAPPAAEIDEEPPSETRATEPPPPARSPSAERTKTRQPAVLIVISILLLLGLLLTVVMLRQERTGPPPKEIPFSDVVREQTAKVAPTRITPDTAAKKAAPLPALSRRDSLTLECATRESVWVRVVVDGGSALEYTFPPDYKIRWKAKKNFLLSLGNAGGVSLTLNGKPLGGLGTPKKPVRNLAISWDTFQALGAPKTGGVQ